MHHYTELIIYCACHRRWNTNKASTEEADDVENRYMSICIDQSNTTRFTIPFALIWTISLIEPYGFTNNFSFLIKPRTSKQEWQKWKYGLLEWWSYYLSMISVVCPLDLNSALAYRIYRRELEGYCLDVWLPIVLQPIIRSVFRTLYSNFFLASFLIYQQSSSTICFSTDMNCYSNHDVSSVRLLSE